jgi:FkbM family methyltransferase
VCEEVIIMRPSTLFGIALGFKDDLMHTIKGDLTLDVALVNLLRSVRILRSLVVGNFAVKLPGGLRIFVNDNATLNINIPDHYLRREYMRHPNYVPGDGWVVLDVGAHVGIYSLWVSRLVGDGFVIAFEPNPIAYRWLISNIELNGATNIKALPYALGDEITRERLYVAGENIGASSLIMNHIINSPAGKYSIVGEFVVPVVTLDYVIDKSVEIVGRPVRRIDLVKVDVEGYEMRVLKGAERALREGLIDRLVIEVHTDQVNTKDLVKYLANHGYTMDKAMRFGNVKDMVYLRLKR